MNGKPLSDKKVMLEAIIAGNSHVLPQDRMIDSATGEVWKIDDRLLLRKTWVQSPVLARRLLTDLSTQMPRTRLSDLAASVLDLTEQNFTASVGSEIDGFVLVLGHALNTSAQPSTELIGRLGVVLELYRANPSLHCWRHTAQNQLCW